MGNGHRNTKCGYCGKNTGTTGQAEHVLPKCMYTSLVDPNFQRLTIPSCAKCNAYWSPHESRFRDLIISIGKDETPHHTELTKTVERNFFNRGELGQAAFDRAYKTIINRVADDGTEVQKIAPFREPSFALVLKKIARGLCYHSRSEVIKGNDRMWIVAGIDDQIPYDELATVYEVPEIFTGRAKFFSRAKGHKVHSVWVLDFFGNRRFVVAVGWRVNRV